MRRLEPTNAGVVLGIDIVTPGLLWAYPYRTQSLTQSTAYERRGRSSPAQIIAEWKAPITLVDRDRVIFTSADEASIHCVSLRDGSLVWKQTRSVDDLWVAGLVAGKVLVVGRRGCRALAWRIANPVLFTAPGMAGKSAYGYEATILLRAMSYGPRRLQR